MSSSKNYEIHSESTVLNSEPAQTVLDSRGHIVIITTSRLIAERHLVYTRALKTLDRVVYYQDLAAKITD